MHTIVPVQLLLPWTVTISRSNNVYLLSSSPVLDAVLQNLIEFLQLELEAQISIDVMGVWFQHPRCYIKMLQYLHITHIHNIQSNVCAV